MCEMRKLEFLKDTAFLAYLRCKTSLTEPTAKLKMTQNISCLQQKYSPAYASNLVICEYNPKLARLAIGLTDT